MAVEGFEKEQFGDSSANFEESLVEKLVEGGEEVVVKPIESSNKNNIDVKNLNLDALDRKTIKELLTENEYMEWIEDRVWDPEGNRRKVKEEQKPSSAEYDITCGGRYIKPHNIRNVNRLQTLETKINDEVFTSSYITENPLYERPDYTQHYITTMDRAVFMLDKRNILTPVRKYPNIAFAGKRMMGPDLSAEIGTHGVYIIDRYVLQGRNGFDIHKFCEYYDHLDTFSKEITGIVRAVYLESVTASRLEPAIIRMVTFVPENDINYHNHLYLPTADLCITTEIPDNDKLPKLVHPRSREYIRSAKSVNKDNENVVKFDIIDNDAPGKSYYVKIGERVERLVSRVDMEEENSCSIIIGRYGVSESTVEHAMPEDYQDHGIYVTHEDAVVNGDRDAELAKLRYVDASETRKEKRELHKLRMEHESSMHEAKHTFMFNKHKLESRLKLDAMAMDIIKTKHKLITTTQETIYKIKLANIQHENKMEETREANALKNKAELIKGTKDMLKTGADIAALFIATMEKIMPE